MKTISADRSSKDVRNRCRGTTARRAGLVAAILLTGCAKESAVKIEDPPEPKIEGETVRFTVDAPQLASIAVQPAEPLTLAMTHVTGRLYWNGDTTVGVFTPVAGRVVAIKADLGEPISVGTPLAEIDSPDFSQALANARTAVGNLAAADKSFTRSKELLEHGAVE